MIYRAKPRLVFGQRIVNIHPPDTGGTSHLDLEGGNSVLASARMLSGFDLAVGDYWVVSPQGAIYLSPKAEFESNYDLVAGVS